MADSLFEEDIDVPVRLPWETICKLAVKARCIGVSLNELCVAAIADAVEQHEKQRKAA